MSNRSFPCRFALGTTAAGFAALAALGDGFTYRTSWVGNSFGGKDGVFVQMDTRTLFTAPDGTCYLNVPWEEDGRNAGLYRDGRPISNPGRTHGWGNGGGVAVVANDTYIFIAQSRNSEGGHLHKRDPESYPPGDRNWFGLTRRTVASGGREAAPARAGRGSGRAIQGLGEDRMAQLAGAFLVINDVPSGREHQHAFIRGLALDNTRRRLYVSNPAKSRIELFDSESLETLGAWPVEHSRQMAVAPDGSLWVVQGALDPWGRPDPEVTGAPNCWSYVASEKLRGYARVLRFSPDGERLPQVIEDEVDLPTGLAFDPQGRLLVADNGPDQQVKIFDVSGAEPALVGTFGEKGGVLAGRRGEIAPLKFNGLQGVGADAAGNLYVAGNGFGGNGSGLTLEAYTPDGERKWALHGLEFVDVGDFDRQSQEADIFTPYERFVMNYGESEPGSEWVYAGYTLDRQRFPHDFRISGFKHNTAWVRNVNGRRYQFGTSMYSSFVTVYRFEDGSETAIPCGLFVERTPKGKRPPNSPEGRFIWVDANGDGQFDAEEFEHDGKNDPDTWAWWVDARGHVWQGYQNASAIVEFPLLEINAHGVPVYSREQAVVHRPPAPFDRPGEGSRIERVQYYPEQDAMFIAGYTPDKPAPRGSWKNAGRVIARYDNWSVKPVKVWEIYPNFEWHDAVPRRITPASFDFAGELLFVIEGRYAVTTIYHAATGVELAEMPPGPEVGKFSGWIDIPYGINAMRRPDGEYLLLAEEDGRAKNLLYRFRVPEETPPGPVAGLAAEGAAGRINVRWQASPRAAAYLVERREGEDGAFVRIGETQGVTAFADRAVLAGRRYGYRIVPVGWGRAGAASAEVVATPTESTAGFEEDFEGGKSALGGLKAVPMPEPRLQGGGEFAAVLGTIAHLPALPVPTGARKVVVRFDRLFLKPSQPGCREHFTRLFVSADGSRDRLGQEQTRVHLKAEDVGRWTPLRAEIALPEGVARLTGGELNNLVGDPQPGYDNPVYIDNLCITFE